MSRSRLGEILVKEKVIDELQLRSAMARREQWGGRIATVVADMGLADEESIYSAISRSLGVKLVHLGTLTRDPQALAKVEVSFAEERAVFPVALRDSGKSLIVAMADPTDLETVDEVGRRSRTRVTAVVASDTEIRHAILRHYRNLDPRVADTGRARKAVQKATASGEEEEEFKITDMAGNTVMKRLSEVEGAPPSAEGGSSASDLLDQMMDVSPHHAFTPEELARIEGVRANQEKSARVLNALRELLTEKGLLP